MIDNNINKQELITGKTNTIIGGVKSSIPVLLGYLPIGTAYGLLAVRAGLSPFLTVLMSVIVFAGSSQLIAADMVAAGSAAVPVIFMAFLVNLRHLLMSAALSLPFNKSGKKRLPVLSFLITDESFAVGNANFKKYKEKDLFFLSMGFANYLGWVISSGLGVILGGILQDRFLPGLDFVLPAMFIVLLVMQVQDKLDIVVAVISAFLSICFVFLLPQNWNILAATVLAAALGVLIEQWKKSTY